MSIEQDEAAIRRAATLYAMGADRRDKSIWSQVLSEDIVIEGPGFRAEGLAANLSNLEYLGQLHTRTQHHVTNQLMKIEGDTASGETYCIADHLTEKDGRREILTWAIRYQDLLVRDGDAWRFKSRTLVVDWEETRVLT